MIKNGLILIMFSLNFTIFAQSDSQTLQISEVEHVEGAYTGTLTYLDYTSNERVELSLTATSKIKKNKLILEFAIPEWGKMIRQKYAYEFKNGTIYNDGRAWKLEEKDYNPDNKRFTYVISKPGKDGNDQKTCIFRLTIAYANDLLTITKDVKFDDEQVFFNRNEYKITRIK